MELAALVLDPLTDNDNEDDNDDNEDDNFDALLISAGSG